MSDSIFLTKITRLACDEPFAVQRRFEPSAQELCLQSVMIKDETAIRLKAFRAEVTAAEMNRSIAAFEQDLATSRWQRPAYTAATVEQKADELSAAHSATLGCHTLEIIHVAAALVLGTKEFVTFDTRQGALARQAGLTVRP